MNERLIAQHRIDTPLGGMLLAATPAGLAGAWFEGQAHHPGVLSAPHDKAQRWLAQAALELQQGLGALPQPVGQPAARHADQEPPGNLPHFFAFRRQVLFQQRFIGYTKFFAEDFQQRRLVFGRLLG